LPFLAFAATLYVENMERKLASIRKIQEIKPIEGAEVYMFGSLLPARGVTDANGRVRLTLFGETTTSVRRLYVKPRMDYWSFYQEQPDISEVAELLSTLPKQQRAAAAMFYVEQLSVLEIAEALEVSEGAVKFHLHQARQKLRAHIESREEQ